MYLSPFTRKIKQISYIGNPASYFQTNRSDYMGYSPPNPFKWVKTAQEITAKAKRPAYAL